MRLVTHYVPLHLPLDTTSVQPERGTPAYYAQRLGGPLSLAQLYLQAGLLHIEGAASVLLSSSYSGLSSIRIPHSSVYHERPETATEAWKRDRENARQYFERAKSLCPSLDVPSLPADRSSGDDDEDDIQLVMPSIELHPAQEKDERVRRRHGEKEMEDVVTSIPSEDTRVKTRTKTLVDGEDDGLDGAWYLYVPGLVGAGTALLVVGVIGALSVSSWRKSQG